jgi:catechol 2,3-dioxygenase-like lactoylglutathione lyase family enzyme
MKRLHVHVSVPDLDQSIRFYSTLFATQPTVRKPDYAKWMLEDPRVNFAISSRSHDTGVDHLGIQVESQDELAELGSRLAEAGEAVRVQKAATCCYARSDKGWVTDPTGLSWETFFTHGEATVYGEDLYQGETSAPAGKVACCAPAADAKAACC